MPDMYKPVKVLFARRAAAFGDWILMADVVSAINDIYPEVQVDIRADPYTRYDLLTCCGCRYRLVKNPNPNDYSGFVPHVLYNTSPVIRNKHILSSMIENVCKCVPYLEASRFKHVKLVNCVLDSDFKLPEKPYVIVPHYTTPLRSSLVKEYPKENYEKLVSLISSLGFDVYELNSGELNGRVNNEPKTYNNSVGLLSTNYLPDTAKILKNARFCVLIENGMNHWACHNGARSFCIFKSHRHAYPDSLYYPTMTPISCYDDESPEYVFGEIRKNL